MKILLALVTFISIYASSYPNFTHHEINHIKKTSGVVVKDRIQNYNHTVEKYKNYSQNEQLVKVNYYLNKILPKANRSYIDKKDYWTTPKEFLTTGMADCEDYAIIKYYTLLKLGFEKENSNKKISARYFI